MGIDNPRTRNKYAALNAVLAAVHYTVSALVISSNSDEQFKVPMVYGYTNWYPGEADAANCAAGCFTQEERITITEDLNIVLIISFFGFISGTNHLIQLGGCLTDQIGDWFTGYTVTVIRNVDYGFSASLMLITVAVLFLAPVDVQTLTYVFCFQFLTQLAGCAAEVIRQLELENFKSTRDGLPEFSLARPIFYSASAIYILPWSLLFYLFYVSGYRTPAPDSVPVAPNPAAAADLEPATPPLQVTFFLGWLFVSFALFPIVMFLKINAGQSVREKNDYGSVASIQDWNFRFELWFNVLSFISKIPLQAFFALGAFNRERIAPVGGDFADDIAETQDDFNARVVASSIWPGITAVVFGMVTLWIFSGDLRLGSFGDFLAKIGWFLAAAALLGVAVFLPVLVAGGDSVGLDVGVGLNSISSLGVVVVAALAQHTYLWLNNGNSSTGASKGPVTFNPTYNPDSSRASLLRYVY